MKTLARRYVRRYAAAFATEVEWVSRYCPPFAWHVRVYRHAVALRRDTVWGLQVGQSALAELQRRSLAAGAR